MGGGALMGSTIRAICSSSKPRWNTISQRATKEEPLRCSLRFVGLWWDLLLIVCRCGFYNQVSSRICSSFSARFPRRNTT